MDRRVRRLDMALALGFAAFLALPFYGIDAGILSVAWLSDYPATPETAPAVAQVALRGAWWLLPLAATLLVALAPIAVTGLLGKVLPEQLIATSDKVTTGLVTLLGTIGALLFRQGPPGGGVDRP